MRYSDFLRIVAPDTAESGGAVTSEASHPFPCAATSYGLWSTHPAHRVLLQMALQRARAQMTVTTQLRVKLSD